MHCVPLIYFRTQSPRDISTLKKFTMTGQAEERVTYPKFLTDKEGELIFTYRDGGSGNGNQIYNRYDPDSGRWSRLLDRPLWGKRELFVRLTRIYGSFTWDAPEPGRSSFLHIETASTRGSHNSVP